MCEVSEARQERHLRHPREVDVADASVVRLRAQADVQRAHGRVHAQALQAKEGAQEMIAKIFPVALIVLDAAAAVVYAACGDWRRFIYWIAAATLTATVTF
jgi:hypothetical protein